MRALPWTAAAGLTLVLAGAGASPAQTNDALFRSWSYERVPSSPRCAALGGALEGTADDAIGVWTNPAAISALNKAELIGAIGTRSARAGVLGDSLSSRTGLALAAGAFHLSPRLAAGAYVAQPHSMRLTLSGTVLPDGLHDDGSLDTTVTEVGTALAWQVGETLHLGARVSVRRLSLQGRYSREPALGATNLRVGTSSANAAPAGAVGVLVVPVPSLRVALVAETGRGFRVTRTATSPVLGVVLDDDSDYELRPPTRLVAGLSFKPHPRVTGFVQAERVRFGEIQARLAIVQGAYTRAEYALDDAWEGGAGAEVSLPFRRMGVQLRAGARTHAGGTLRYRGEEAVAGATFTGSPGRATFSTGAGLFLRGGLHLDAAVTVGDGTSVLAGAGMRF